MRRSKSEAYAKLANCFSPITFTSIGAGWPKLRICETMSAGRNENVVPGKLARQFRSQCLDRYLAVGE